MQPVEGAMTIPNVGFVSEQELNIGVVMLEHCQQILKEYLPNRHHFTSQRRSSFISSDESHTTEAFTASFTKNLRSLRNQWSLCETVAR